MMVCMGRGAMRTASVTVVCHMCRCCGVSRCLVCHQPSAEAVPIHRLQPLGEVTCYNIVKVGTPLNATKAQCAFQLSAHQHVGAKLK